MVCPRSQLQIPGQDRPRFSVLGESYSATVAGGGGKISKISEGSSNSGNSNNSSDSECNSSKGDQPLQSGCEMGAMQSRAGCRTGQSGHDMHACMQSTDTVVIRTRR